MGRRAVPVAVVLLCGLAVLHGGSARARTAPRLAESEVALAEGIAAFQSGQYKEAAEWFARARELNPDGAEPRSWYGLALEAGQRSAAGQATPAELPQEDRPIDDRGLWEGIAGLSLASDSNPNLLSSELSLPEPKGSLVRGEQADAKARPGLSLGIYPFHDRPGPSLGVTLEARRWFQEDFGFLDLGQVRGAVQLAFGSDPLGYLKGPLGHARVPFGDSRFSALLQTGGTTYRLDNDPYLRTWEGGASLTFHELSATATRLDLGWADRSFSQGRLVDGRRSGRDLSVQASQLFFFGRRDRYVRIGGLAVDRSAGRPFAESIREGNAELAMPFALRWTVHLEGSVRKDDFDHPESNLFATLGPIRNDRTERGALTLVWAATERLRLTARGTYVSRSSNVDLGVNLPDLEYRRTIASVGASWVF